MFLIEFCHRIGHFGKNLKVSKKDENALTKGKFFAILLKSSSLDEAASEGGGSDISSSGALPAPEIFKLFFKARTVFFCIF